jgi:S1-C subfamily serine protease
MLSQGSENPAGNAILPSASMIAGGDPAEEIVIHVYEKVSPVVVHITTVRQSFNIFYGPVPQEGTGSGVIISAQGYILTNNHVIKDAQTVTVTFFDGSFEDATVVGVDQFTDLAILKVEKEIESSWVAELGDSDKLRVGQRAIAIGNPFGFDHTLSVGVISALGRPIKTPEAEYDDMIQTDASVNPGNSGGPLINSGGEVIGINTSIFSRTGTSLGIGFAIPSNSCKKVAEDIIQYGRVRRPYLGVTAFALQPRIALELGINVNSGLLVQSVAPGSPAEKVGLKAGTEPIRLRYGFYFFDLVLGGDIIVAVNGENMFTEQQLTKKIKKLSPGETVTLTVLRGTSTLELEAQVETEP